MMIHTQPVKLWYYQDQWQPKRWELVKFELSELSFIHSFIHSRTTSCVLWLDDLDASKPHSLGNHSSHNQHRPGLHIAKAILLAKAIKCHLYSLCESHYSEKATKCVGDMRSFLWDGSISCSWPAGAMVLMWNAFNIVGWSQLPLK